MDSPFGNRLLLVPEDPVLRQQRLRRWAIWTAVLLVVVLIGLAVRPVARHVRSWHARRLAAEGIELMEAREWKKAAAAIEQAYRLAPRDPEVLRSEARLLTQGGYFAPALFIWKQVVSKGVSLSPVERREYATAALEGGEFGLAEKEAKKLGANTPADTLLAARLADRLGDHGAAVDFARRVLSFRESAEQERYDACMLLLGNSAEAEVRTFAWSALWEIAQGSSATAMNALLYLARQLVNAPMPVPQGLPQDIPTVIHRLNEHPHANAFSRLRAMDLQIKTNPSREEAFMEEAITQYQGNDATLGTLCSWLLARNKPIQALALLPVEKAALSMELSALRILGLSALDDWERIESELAKATPDLNVDDLSAEIYLARAAARLGKEAAFQNRWERCFELAAGDKRKLVTVGRAAEQEKLFDRAERAYEAAVAIDPRDRANFSLLLRFAAARSGAAKAYEILTRMTQQWPDDPGIRNAEVHAGLLAGMLAPEKAREMMEPLVQRHAANFSYRATLALALLRLKEPAAALRAFGDSVSISSAVPLLPSTRAIHALTLASNNMSTLARMEAEKIPLGNLVQEERMLVQPLLSSSAE